MFVTFHGAVREVTGSMHLVEANNSKILLDCGMFQGPRQESRIKNRDLPFDAATITNVVLSHAHIDHSGRIPFLAQSNFNGRVICTRATADVCKHLLLDSAKIQESDADYLNYKAVRSFLHSLSNPSNHSVSNREKKDIKALLKKSVHEINVETIHELLEKHYIEKTAPLYTIKDAENSINLFDGYPYQYPVDVGDHVQSVFYDAGHILGSAFTFLRLKENGRSFTVGFTGDMGRFDKPILRDPTLEFLPEDCEVDLLIMESTYGGREHEAVGGLKEQLRDVLVETFNRGGTVVIPSFAFGRTQEIIYYLRELYDAGEVPKLPVYVDSPLATQLTKVTGEHPEIFDRETHKEFLEQGENPFIFPQMHFTHSVEESMVLMKDNSPHIVISASGMCEFGRILHHLRHKIHDSRHTILVVGFMAERTLGRRILELGQEYRMSGYSGEPPAVKFLNKIYPLKARVVQLEGFSAHGDRKELLRLVKESNLKIKRIALVHGEEAQALPLEKELLNEGFSVFVPQKGERIELH